MFPSTAFASTTPLLISRASSPPTSTHRPSTLRLPHRACAASPSDPTVDDDGEAPQGPAAPAPMVKGVSTVGLEEREAALLTACYGAEVGEIESALDAGADVTARDVNRRSALHFCAGNGLVGVVERLIDAGADKDAQDMLGLTPLHMATGYKKAGTVKYLAKAGADANVACYGGELPVELAERLLAATPEKKFLMPNKEFGILKEIVDCLDLVTEEEEGGDEVDDEEEGEAVKAEFAVRPPAPKAAVNVDPGVKESVEVKGDATFTVRKREKAPDGAEARTTATASTDAEVVIRRPGEK